ncbi:MAG: hypothetical protein NZ901_00400 [Geminocystis sp.]|nr:hypothetical protein [Geminocystis sp.]MCS7146628.1 hypothetical protein [Geminocystis sp.]MCX8077223.1 hypothetical protein [Geminocystis sp.]MDW8115454.1 hypothetical protein [Geminocystis sp.]MDW8462995.1 hypothetical protein [Geminocystis sp.]
MVIPCARADSGGKELQEEECRPIPHYYCKGYSLREKNPRLAYWLDGFDTLLMSMIYRHRWGVAMAMTTLRL